MKADIKTCYSAENKEQERFNRLIKERDRSSQKKKKKIKSGVATEIVKKDDIVNKAEMLIKRLSISDPYKMDISKLLEAAEANNQKLPYNLLQAKSLNSNNEVAKINEEPDFDREAKVPNLQNKEKHPKRRSKLRIRRSPSPKKIHFIKENKKNFGLKKDGSNTSTLNPKCKPVNSFNDYYPNEVRPRTSYIRNTNFNNSLNIQNKCITRSKIKIAFKDQRYSSVAGSTKISETPKCSTLGDRRKWVEHFYEETFKRRKRSKSFKAIGSISMEEQIKRMLKKAKENES